MKEFNYVPMFRQGLNELTDGIEIKATEFCLKNCVGNLKCQEYYRQLLDKNDGNYACPFGFASTVFSDKEGAKYIFTGIRLEGTYVPKLADPKVKLALSNENHKRNNRKIALKELKTYINYYLEYKNGVEAYRDMRAFVEDIFHDIRKFNGQMKCKSTRLYSKAKSGGKGTGQFLELAQNIQAISAYMSLRLNAYDFTYNEELLAASEKSSYNIYRIFDKVKHCLNDRTAERNVDIDIECNGECGDIKAYDSIELLPYILLDNAVKYSNSHSHIKVMIKDTPLESCFSVTSQSPALKKGEKERIFGRGFRGENAREMTGEGLGIGLYTAKKICEIHKGMIAAEEVWDNKKNVNNFIIDIRLDKAYNI